MAGKEVVILFVHFEIPPSPPQKKIQKYILTGRHFKLKDSNKNTKNEMDLAITKLTPEVKKIYTSDTAAQCWRTLILLCEKN